MSQPRSANPFRPGSGIFPPLPAGREREKAVLEVRVARTREGHPHPTALRDDCAIGNSMLVMYWRRLRQQAGDTVDLAWWVAMSRAERKAVAMVAAVTEARPSGETESAALGCGIRAATREALRRLAAAGGVDSLANGQRGRYLVRHALFRRYLELQGRR